MQYPVLPDRLLGHELGKALDQQRAQPSIPVTSAAPGNDPDGLGDLRWGDEAPVERLVKTQHASRREPPGAGPAGSLLALPEQGPCEPAGRPEPVDLTLGELARAGEGRRRTEVHQSGGSRQPDVRRVREREGERAQLPAACRTAQVTDRLADGGEGRVYAAGRVATPRLPRQAPPPGRLARRRAGSTAPRPSPSGAAPRAFRRRGPRAASPPRHDAVLGSNRASAVQPCCGAVLLIGSSPAYCIPYGTLYSQR